MIAYIIFGLAAVQSVLLLLLAWKTNSASYLLNSAMMLIVCLWQIPLMGKRR